MLIVGGGRVACCWGQGNYVDYVIIKKNEKKALNPINHENIGSSSRFSIA